MSKRKRTELPAALKMIDVKAVLRRRGIYLKQRENIRLKQAALPLAAVVVKNKKAKKLKKEIEQPPQQPAQKYSSFTDEAAVAYWEKQIHNVSTIEEHFDIALRRFLTDQVLVKALSKLDEVVDNNKSAKAQAKALESIKKDIFDDQEQDDLVAQAQIDLEPLLQNMAIIAGQDANKLIGTDDPYIVSDALRKRIADNVALFAKSMVDTDQEHLTSLIVNGIQSGDSIQQIRSIITEDFKEYSNMQAQRITRTEVLRAANQSTLDAFKQSGVVEGQQWLTAGADDECADYDGLVETLDNGFYDGGDNPFQDGEPPLHPNCRCVLIPVLQEISSTDNSEASFSTVRIKELEAQIDKRTKEFRELKQKHIDERADDKAYIKSLEKYLKVEDEQT